MQPELRTLASPGSRVLCGESFCSGHVERLRDLISMGRDQESIAIGYHGTSFLALEIAMRTGHLPTGRSPGNEGHLYFFPLSAAALTCEGFNPKFEGDEADREGFENAHWYARNRTRAALFAQILEVDLTCDKVWGLMSYISDIDDVDDVEGLEEETLSDFGLSKKAVAGALAVYHRSICTRRNDEEQGYILLLGRSALDAQPPLVGDCGYDDMKIKVDPPGLPIEHLVGVHPITPGDRRRFQQMLKLYGI